MSILASGLWGDLAKAIGNSTGKVIQAFKRADPTTAIAGGLAGGGAISEAVRLARDVIAHREVNKMLDGGSWDSN